MNANVKTALGIGLIVVLAAAITAGLFVWTGSQVATWFVLIGIPLIVVSGIAVYVRGVVARSGTSETQFVRQRGRTVAEEFQKCVREYNELVRAYPTWRPGVEAQLESIAGDLRTQGIEFDLESGAFDLSKKVSDADLQELERVSTDVDLVQDTITAEFRAFTDDELSTIEAEMTRLESVDLVRIDRLPQYPPENASTAECRDAIEEARTEMDTTIEGATSAVREMARGETRPDDLDAIESDLERADAATEDHDYADAVEAALEARDRLREEFSGSFDAERDALLDLIDAVESVGVDEYVDAGYVADVERVESAVTGLDSALELSELSRHRSTLRRTCVDMVAALERDLEADVRVLREAELPPGYYSEPAVVGETFVDELDEIDSLGPFTDRWIAVTSDLVEAVETAKTKAAVIDAYDDIAETIDEELDRSGEVVGSDLPIRHADQFLGLYYRRNPSVEFDPDVPAIRRGAVETFDLEVEIEYERGGPVRTATIDVSSGSYEETSTVETRIADSVTFADVPAGAVTVEGDPGDDAFSKATVEFELDADDTVQIEFLEQSLRERLCADVDDEVKQHLPEVRPRFETLFEEEGYVSTAMDLPIRRSHAPCLLALWAADAGYEVVDDEEVVVFERDRITQEINNVVRYNLEPGTELSLDELERKFLSAPVPAAVIREIVDEIDTEYSIRITDTTMEVK